MADKRNKTKTQKMDEIGAVLPQLACIAIVECVSAWASSLLLLTTPSTPWLMLHGCVGWPEPLQQPSGTEVQLRSTASISVKVSGVLTRSRGAFVPGRRPFEYCMQKEPQLRELHALVEGTCVLAALWANCDQSTVPRANLWSFVSVSTRSGVGGAQRQVAKL